MRVLSLGWLFCFYTSSFKVLLESFSDSCLIVLDRLCIAKFFLVETLSRTSCMNLLLLEGHLSGLLIGVPKYFYIEDLVILPYAVNTEVGPPAAVVICGIFTEE